MLASWVAGRASAPFARVDTHAGSGLTAPPEAAKLIRCATAPLSAECALPPPPEVFDVRFYFGQGGNATFRIHRASSPPYASLFWHLVSLGYCDDI